MDHQQRMLKIYRKYRIRIWDTIRVPEIRLEGKWLEKLGFTIGSGISVSVEQDKLVIIVDENHRAPLEMPTESYQEGYYGLYR